MTTRRAAQNKGVEEVPLPGDEPKAVSTPVVMPPLQEAPLAAEKEAAPPVVDSAREVFVMSWGDQNFQDFAPHPIDAKADVESVSGILPDDQIQIVVPSDEEFAAELDEESDEDVEGSADPKDSSAPAPASSSESLSQESTDAF